MATPHIVVKAITSQVAVKTSTLISAPAVKATVKGT